MSEPAEDAAIRQNVELYDEFLNARFLEQVRDFANYRKDEIKRALDAALRSGEPLETPKMRILTGKMLILEEIADGKLWCDSHVWANSRVSQQIRSRAKSREHFDTAMGANPRPDRET